MTFYSVQFNTEPPLVCCQTIINGWCFLFCFQYLTFNFPLMIHLGHWVDMASKQQPNHSLLYQNILRWVQHNLSFLILLLFQIYMAYSGIYRAYGTMAFFIGPVRTWSVPFALWLRWYSLRPKHILYKELNNDNHCQTNNHTKPVRRSSRLKKAKEWQKESHIVHV